MKRILRVAVLIIASVLLLCGEAFSVYYGDLSTQDHPSTYIIDESTKTMTITGRNGHIALTMWSGGNHFKYANDSTIFSLGGVYEDNTKQISYNGSLQTQGIRRSNVDVFSLALGDFCHTSYFCNFYGNGTASWNHKNSELVFPVDTVVMKNCVVDTQNDSKIRSTQSGYEGPFIYEPGEKITGKYAIRIQGGKYNGNPAINSENIIVDTGTIIDNPTWNRDNYTGAYLSGTETLSNFTVGESSTIEIVQGSVFKIRGGSDDNHTDRLEATRTITTVKLSNPPIIIDWADFPG